MCSASVASQTTVPLQIGFDPMVNLKHFYCMSIISRPQKRNLFQRSILLCLNRLPHHAVSQQAQTHYLMFRFNPS